LINGEIVDGKENDIRDFGEFSFDPKQKILLVDSVGQSQVGIKVTGIRMHGALISKEQAI